MQAVNRVSVVQQVAENIREYIMSGEIEVGDKLLSEMKLCEMLGVGRGTVREAIRVLQMSGFVEMRPGRGAFVARTTEPDNDDLFGWFKTNEAKLMDFLRVRSALEPLAIRLAIQHRNEKDVEALSQIHQKTMRAVSENNAPMLAMCDEEFHAYIFTCSRNEVLISINRTISNALKNFRGKTFHIPTNAKNVLEPHGDILFAFLSGDADEGEKMMKKHMDYIIRDLEKSKGK